MYPNIEITNIFKRIKNSLFSTNQTLSNCSFTFFFIILLIVEGVVAVVEVLVDFSNFFYRHHKAIPSFFDALVEM
jgi:hypothetical protein